jgi:hypothetical protein
VSAIKAGDLVMVVHSCCGDQGGIVFTVGSLYERASWTCDACKHREKAIQAATSATQANGRLCHWPIAWLKRIDPLSDPEEAQTKVEREEKKRSPVNA